MTRSAGRRDGGESGRGPAPGRRFLTVLITLAAVNAAGWIVTGVIGARAPGARETAHADSGATGHRGTPTRDVDVVRIERAAFAAADGGPVPDRLSVWLRGGTRALRDASAAAPGASRGDAWPTIDPPLPGRWVLASPERLDFVLESPPAPGLAVHVRAGGDADTGAVHARAEVPPAAMTGARIRDTGEAYVTLAIEFDRPVDADWARSRVTLHGGEAPDAIAGVEWRTGGTERVHVVRCPRPAARALRVAGMDRAFTCEIPRRFTILGCDPAVAVRDEPSEVVLRFTRPLATPIPDAAIAVDPPVPGLRISAEGTRLHLRGRFTPGSRVMISLPAGLSDVTGETLGSDTRVTAAIDPPSPEVALPGGSGTLAPGGLRSIVLESIDVPRVRVRIIRLHEDLVPAFLRGLRAEDAGRVIHDAVHAVTDDARGLPTHARLRTRLDLGALAGDDARGIFVVRVSDERTAWRSATATVALSDLAPVIRVGADDAFVWVTSIGSGQPVNGAEVHLLGRAGRTVATGGTDASGCVRLPVPAAHPDGPIVSMLVRHDGACAVLPIERGGTPPAVEDDRPGEPGRVVPRGLDVFLYAERGVHRPGETVYLTGVVRDAHGALPPMLAGHTGTGHAPHAAAQDGPADGLPLEVELRDPTGRVVRRVRTEARAGFHGFFHAALPTNPAGATGVHEVAVRLPGSEHVLARLDAPIEPFVPRAMTVSVEPVAARPGAVRVRATRLAGLAARGLAVRLTAEVRRARPVVPGRERFLFGEDNFGEDHAALSAPPGGGARDLGAAVVRRLPGIEGRLGDDGAWEGGWPLEALEPGDVAVVTATVLETGGRSQAATCRMRAPAVDDVLLGIDPVRTGGRSGEGWTVRGLLLAGARDVVDASPLPPPGALACTVDRLVSSWRLELQDERAVWRRDVRRERVAEALLAVRSAEVEPGVFLADLPPLPEGSHIVTLRAGGRETATSFRVEIAPAEGGDGMVEAESTGSGADSIEVVLPDPLPEPGSTARLLVRAPFAGTALFTLEDDRVRHAQVTALPAGASEVEVSIPITIRGDVVLSALLVRGVDATRPRWEAHRAVASRRLRLDRAPRTLPLTVTPPVTAVPGERVSITVRAGDPSVEETVAVHLWAVDEGIVQAAPWIIPDPCAHFLGARRHTVRHHDARARLLPDHTGLHGVDRIGGDQAMRGRRGPAAAVPAGGRITWQETVTVVAGEATTVAMPMPESVGRVRLLSVAASGERFGAASAFVGADVPVLLETTVPSTMAPGDDACLALRIIGRAPVPMTLDVEEHAGAGLVLLRRAEARRAPDDRTIQDGAQRLTLMPGEEHVLWFDLRAAGAGVHEVDFTVRIRGESAHADVRPPGAIVARRRERVVVRPAMPVVEIVEHRAGTPGAVIRLDPIGAEHVGANHVRAGRVVEIGYGATPDLERLVESLIEYPYGCAEQTAARLRGLLAVRAVRPSEEARVEPLIDAALERLAGMQRPDGAFTLWPGSESGPQERARVTRLVAGAVAQALRRAPYGRGGSPDGPPDGPPDGSGPYADLHAGLVRALRAELTRPTGSAHDASRADALDALAELGAPDPTWVRVVAERAEDLDAESLVRLGRAALEGGMHALAVSLADRAIAARRVSAGAGARRFASPVTRDAALLLLLRRLQHDPDRITGLLAALRAAAARPCSTLDAAAIVEALGAPAVTADDGPRRASPGAVVVRLDDGPPSEVPVGGETVRIPAPPEATVQIALPVRDAQAVTIVHRFRGPATGHAARSVVADSGLRLRRTWRREDGSDLVPGGRVRLGDTISVEIELAASDDRARSDVAIVDLLPGGFSVEHPGLAATLPSDGVRVPGADRAEFHDDRVVLFATAPPGGDAPRRMRYTMRAIVSGRFAVPGAEAACMYEPGTSAWIAAEGHVEVEG